MLETKDILIFKNALLYLSNLAMYQFEAVAEDIWGERGQHMTMKLWREKKENIWAFFISLDDLALEELTSWIRQNNFCS